MGGGDVEIKAQSLSVQPAWGLSWHQHMRPLMDSIREQALKTHGDPTAQTACVWMCQQVRARCGTCTALGRAPLVLWFCQQAAFP